MQIITIIKELLTYKIGLLSWRDPLEIIILSTIIYYCLLWLRQDTQKNFLLWFYSYAILFFGSYYVGLQTLSFLLIFFTPCVGLFFIIMHQHVLQKNFITLSRVVPREEHNWLDILVSCSLYAVNQQREIMWVLERHDALDMFLTSHVALNAPLTHNVIDLIINLEKDKNMIWINTKGHVVAHDVAFAVHDDKNWQETQVAHCPPWKQDALFITSKTDAIVIKASLDTRLFDVIIYGISIEKISATGLYNLLQECYKKNVREEVITYVNTHYQSYQNYAGENILNS